MNSSCSFVSSSIEYVWQTDRQTLDEKLGVLSKISVVCVWACSFGWATICTRINLIFIFLLPHCSIFNKFSHPIPRSLSLSFMIDDGDHADRGRFPWNSFKIIFAWANIFLWPPIWSVSIFLAATSTFKATDAVRLCVFNAIRHGTVQCVAMHCALDYSRSSFEDAYEMLSRSRVFVCFQASVGTHMSIYKCCVDPPTIQCIFIWKLIFNLAVKRWNILQSRKIQFIVDPF